MNNVTNGRWKKMRTEDSRKVEAVLRQVFPKSDAYRYNSASIRVRVIDDRFAGKPNEKRDALVEPLLAQLPETIQSDILNLVLLSPEETDKSLGAAFANSEFEDPSPSIL